MPDTHAANTDHCPVSGTSPHKTVEKQSPNRRSALDCSTTVSHTSPLDVGVTPSKQSDNGLLKCSTRLSHRR